MGARVEAHFTTIGDFLMDELKVTEYIQKLLSSNINKHDVLLMVYDFLHDQYSPELRNNILDTLREPLNHVSEPDPESIVQELEIEVPKAIPAEVISTYYLQQLSKRNYE